MARVAGSSRETGNLRRGADKPCTLRSAANAINEQRIRVCAEIQASEEGVLVCCGCQLARRRARAALRLGHADSAYVLHC